MQIQPADDAPVTVARATGSRSEILLRRRGRGNEAVHELIVNGAFAMDSAETSSERELARLLFPWGAAHRRVLVGGLGLGYTAAEALDLGVSEIDVVELEAAMVGWAEQGLTPTLSRVASDPRAHLVIGDIADVLASPAPTAQARGSEPPAWDAIALDVDNGPDFLIHAENASLYTAELLNAAYQRLRPGGRLAIWCQGPSPLLMEILSGITPTARQHIYPVSRAGRHLAYAICTLDRPPTPLDTPE